MQVCVRSIVIQIIDSLTGPRPPENRAWGKVCLQKHSLGAARGSWSGARGREGEKVSRVACQQMGQLHKEAKPTAQSNWVFLKQALWNHSASKQHLEEGNYQLTLLHLPCLSGPTLPHGMWCPCPLLYSLACPGSHWGSQNHTLQQVLHLRAGMWIDY